MKNVLFLLMLFSAHVLASPVNINTADAQMIADSLSNVGLKKAEAIVAYRNKNGAFKSVDELGQVSGIGDKTIEKNKMDILLSDPAATTSASVVEPTDKSDKKK
ncbi:MAG: helix-hairpin-helix domain-containing protein [Methylovulum sp.]|nr:helix-hairpin-helix domain-containing protein [Methylovulum sp.]